MAILGYEHTGDESSDDEQWGRRTTRTLLIWADLGADSNFVRQNCGFAKFQPHPYDSGQFVLTRKAVNQGFAKYVTGDNSSVDAQLFEVTIEYGPYDPYTMTSTGNPADMKCLATWINQRFPDVADSAISGTNDDGSPKVVPCLNSAFDPFNPGIPKDRLQGVFKVVENRLQGTFNPASLAANNCYINSDTWNGFAKHTVRWSMPEVPDQPFSMFLGLNYYRLEHIFEVNTLGWDAQVYDMGTRQLDNGSPAKPVKILDSFGNPVMEPVFLDGQGKRRPLDSSDPLAYATFQIYNEISFTDTFGPKFMALFP